MLFKKTCLKLPYFLILLSLSLFLLAAPAIAETEEEEVIILDEEALPWVSDKEAPKSNLNLIRIKFNKGQKDLSEEDEKAVEAMLKILGDPDQRIKIKSYANDGAGDQKSREMAMQRMLNLRQSLIDAGFDISNANFFAFGSKGNKQNLDYIDIDKY